MVAALFVGCQKEETSGETKGEEPAAAATDMRVAMVTDYGDITDESFNQATYEGAKTWCEENGVDFTYYKPTGDSTAERVAMIDKAVSEGYNVLLMPGYAFAGAIVETVELYPDVKFVALDVSEFDLQDAHGTADDFSWEYPANLYSAVYQEELAGYMAGVAAVKLGYTKIGYLGGMAVPAVIRYGYGFVQGVNDAAKELGNVDDIELKYVYGNQFFGDADITAYMDTWYNAGTEVVFACGGGIYASAAEAAQKVHGKVIGVDVDQAPTIDGKYEDGMTVTSAMKGLSATVKTLLGKIKDGSFEGGKVENLGLVSEKSDENYVQLPASTQWGDGFTEDDYNALVADLFNGKITVSNDTENEPAVDIAVDYQGNIK
jgi:basic membrane protein A